MIDIIKDPTVTAFHPILHICQRSQGQKKEKEGKKSKNKNLCFVFSMPDRKHQPVNSTKYSCYVKKSFLTNVH